MSEPVYEEKLQARLSSRPEKVAATDVIDIQPGQIEYENVDKAFNFALEVDDEPIDPVAEKKLVRKIDFTIFPVMCLVYCIQFLDKTSNSYAAIMGIEEEMHMVGNMYAWSGTAFYLGYLVFEMPASFLLQRFPLAKTLFVFLILWGIFLCVTPACNYAGFIAMRTLLGMMESSVSPGFVLLTAQWYKREEQPVRTAFWVACNGMGQILGGCIAYGLAKREDSLPIAGWKLVFIICGVLAIFLAIVLVIVIPDTPLKAWFLNDEEKKLIIKRLRTNQQGVGNSQFKMDQFKEALIDVRTWIMFFSSIALMVPNGGIGTFSSLLIKGTMGYDTLETLLMGLPAGGSEVVTLVIIGLVTPYVRHRMTIATISTTLSLVGACMLAFAKLPGAALAGYYIIMISPGAMIVFFSLISTNTAGHTKKVTVGGIYLVGYCVGNLIGPQTFQAKDAPDYKPAKVAMVACYAITLLTFPMIAFVNWKENKRRDQLAAEGKIPHIENAEFADLTDFQNLNFRYAI